MALARPPRNGPMLRHFSPLNLSGSTFEDWAGIVDLDFCAAVMKLKAIRVHKKSKKGFRIDVEFRKRKYPENTLHFQ